MGDVSGSEMDRHIAAFVDFARSRMARETWEELEPTLAASWSELSGGLDMPPWPEIGPKVRAQCCMPPPSNLG